jgi:hypothetical protein
MGNRNSGRALPRTTVEQVYKLLDAGHSGQQVARQLGIGRTAVYKILKARGKRDARERAKGAAQRCGGCGAVVRLPCLRCKLVAQLGVKGFA